MTLAAGTMPPRLGIAWPLSTVHGWGVFATNLALALVRRGRPAPALLEPPLALDLDTLRRRALDPYLAEATALQARLAAEPGLMVAAGFPIIHALGNGFVGNTVERRRGRPDIGMVFLEDTALGGDARERAGRYALVAAGSSWLAGVLDGLVAAPVRTVLQGVDAALFHPGPRSWPLGRKFLVFSGGKIEDRKGQDLVVAAFRRFRTRHPEAVLVAAWHNPMPQFARSITSGGIADTPPELRPDGRLDTAAWAARQGLGPEAFVDLGAVANPRMAEVLREMDAAIFPNRCEGGTNLVAMECMAAGVPTILSANTGHLDLLAGPDVALPLTRQRPVARPGIGTAGWGESDVDEMVEALERIRARPDEAADRARRAAAWMAGQWSWDTRAAELCALVAQTG